MGLSLAPDTLIISLLLPLIYIADGHGTPKCIPVSCRIQRNMIVLTIFRFVFAVFLNQPEFRFV